MSGSGGHPADADGRRPQVTGNGSARLGRRVWLGLLAGVLLLAAASSEASFARAGSGADHAVASASAASTTSVFTYKVSYAANTTNTGSFSPGSWTTTEQYSGTWPAFRVTVSYGSGKRVTDMSGSAPSGSLSASYSYTAAGLITEGSGNNNPSQTCAGTYTQTLPSTLAFGALYGQPAAFNAYAGSGFSSGVVNVLETSCPANLFGTLPQGAYAAFTASDGVTLVDYDASGLSWTAPFTTQAAFPLKALAGGQAFVIKTGTWTSPWPDAAAQGDGGLSASTTSSVTVTFAPVKASGGGTAACHVPSLKGHTLASARSRLKAAGCSLGKVTTTSTRPQEELHVTAQKPKAGATRPHGSPVNVSLG